MSYALGPGILFPPRALKLSKFLLVLFIMGFSKNKKYAKTGFKISTCPIALTSSFETCDAGFFLNFRALPPCLHLICIFYLLQLLPTCVWIGGTLPLCGDKGRGKGRWLYMNTTICIDNLSFLISNTYSHTWEWRFQWFVQVLLVCFWYNCYAVCYCTVVN